MRSAAWLGDWPITQAYNPPNHMGVDIGMPVGRSLFALLPGFVERVQAGLLSIRVGSQRHFYLHIDHALCTPGQNVVAFQLVAVSGAVVVDPRFPITGPHLHYEVQEGYTLPGIPSSPGASRDPIPFLEAYELTPQQEAWLVDVHSALARVETALGTAPGASDPNYVIPNFLGWTRDVSAALADLKAHPAAADPALLALITQLQTAIHGLTLKAV